MLETNALKEQKPSPSRAPISRRIAKTLKPLPPVDQLLFGKHFSDHCFYSKYTEADGWHESRIEPYGPIQLEPTAGVFHYGQALFEGMKAFRHPNGEVKLFRPDFNCTRMQDGAKRICLPPPTRDLFMDAIRELITLDERWVPAEKGASLYIRPTLIGTQPLLKAVPSQEALFFVILSPAGPYFGGRKTPVRIYVETDNVRAAPGGLGATKAGANYVASFQSAIRANQKGFDQVLWLDVNHEGIEEVGTMNVFFVMKGEIVTPALNGSILSGGTRDSVLHILREKGLPVKERRITMTEILSAQREGRLLEAFGTGTAAVISPIGELNYKGEPYHINAGEIGGLTQQLYDTITGIQYGTTEDPYGWMVPLASVR
jgi:branched-chain amino acid aminotransferase